MLRPALWPWWVQVLVVYALARLVSAGIFLAVASTQAPNLWTPGSPSYPQYTGGMWDATWYRGIAEQGYPAELPRGADGAVLQNPWAFFPLFPSLVRLVMVTGVGWEVAAPALALVLGALTMLVVHQVVAVGALSAGEAWVAQPDLPPDHPAADQRWAQHLPLATVAVLTTSASAPVLQVAYTESLALLLLAAVLWCIQRRYYLAAMPLVLGLGLTRAVALPLAVAVAAHAVARWRSPDRPRIVALLVATVAAGALWPALVALATGELQAFTQTQGAWRGRREVVPVVPWFDVARWLFGDVGLLLLAAIVAAAVLVVGSATMRSLGPELQWWTAGYLGYLLLAVEPGSSLLRFALLAFPVAAVVAGWALRRRWWRAALASLLLLGVAGQVGWIGLLWRLVPPAGWPP